MKQQKENKVKPVGVSLRPDLALWARVYAAKKNMSRSQFIAALLESAQKQAQEMPPVIALSRDGGDT